MSEPKPNNPYARPINATRATGQMLQSEFYGERAKDKQLAGHRGSQVSPASRFVGRAIATPAGIEPPTEKKARKPRGPKADKVIIDQPVSTVETAITEDDLFG